MSSNWSWCEETTHLEVRPAIRGEGPVVKIEGGVAKADRDWIYWRLPTVCTREVLGDGDRLEAKVRLEKGEVRVGVITANVKLGDNWCDRSKVGHAFFLDTFFGVLRDGDNVIASGSKLKAASNDVITIKLQQSALEFHVNGAEVGLVHVDPMQQLRVAAQMWDRGDCVCLPGVAAKPGTLDISSLSFGQSPIKPPASTRRGPADQPPPEAPPARQGPAEECAGEACPPDSQRTPPDPQPQPHQKLAAEAPEVPVPEGGEIMPESEVIRDHRFDEQVDTSNEESVEEQPAEAPPAQQALPADEAPPEATAVPAEEQEAEAAPAEQPPPPHDTSPQATEVPAVGQPAEAPPAEQAPPADEPAPEATAVPAEEQEAEAAPAEQPPPPHDTSPQATEVPVEGQPAEAPPQDVWDEEPPAEG